MDDTRVHSNKYKHKGKCDEAEQEEGPLCISKAQQGVELIIGDGCWVVDNLDDVAAGKGKDECALPKGGQDFYPWYLLIFLASRCLSLVSLSK